MELRLIYKEAHRARATGLEFADRVCVAALAALEAEKAYDESKGAALNTLIVTYIRTALRRETRKYMHRVKYDGVQVSCLTKKQLRVPANVPNPEQQAIFRDSLEKLPKDAKTLVNLALHTPRAHVEGPRPQVNVLSTIRQQLLRQGWTTRRWLRALSDVKAILK